MNDNNKTLGWGKTDESGVEIWDDNPVFQKDAVDYKDRLKLLFYPKKFLLYRYIAKAKKRTKVDLKEPYRVLDVGCGTGASVIDLKKLLGREVEVRGIDVVRLQVELAKQKILKNAVWAEADWYDGRHIMFPDYYFDAIYTSDVLGHVIDAPVWLKEMSRVLRPGGVLAMFSESELGRHAYIRKYLLKKGLNIDPHEQYHISLYSKDNLKKMLNEAGFEIKNMYNSFWLSFLVHPDEFYEKLQGQTPHHKGAGLKKFPILKIINFILYKIKKKMGKYGLAAAELYGLVEMLTIGRWIEAQGYVILGKKK
ncbi:MAG: hypothetical protein A2469_02645 [Candidatus Magasanikbacteria bacterium RIFOXYC2_FULL_40_16]|uniref:Methyltransferase type 11 domain-containing protein n=3 Tax=Candidatus Magasanikiibacteriota TaxID=1752731 RepID=A0A1F6NJU3_9BACT|nr:MAG: hypothetical protein A2224_01755 [Candidatus Magasanikbacteria bacterium RIFOXYA2_FULL_40_20]OGH84139.1 MAG: hypothetical protein A2373_02795 [Candidatus Magasanikbacteria bacterium RIFOXYB1_FULL_40_15]OGH86771.1 MAG: hypothetical protein A2301_01730 [Candidatus Magasanikbacteria bacterium RIFOXYB2_FULL_40_13]OGH87143.1 MAG: hypothetical protein A2206_00595 [Candidatus Magasanikbacteria bacterium RIFOXYA1_FULL_40_8]OGH89175.1 MAG: hypothetical protein A2469_02645 [Candidatus Magasanikba